VSVVPAVLGGIAPVRLGPSPCAVILGLNREGMAPRPEIKIHAANPGGCLLVAMHKPTPREYFPVTGQYFRVTGQCFRMTGRSKSQPAITSVLGRGAGREFRAVGRRAVPTRCANVYLSCAA
jgi:hypothetical protein